MATCIHCNSTVRDNKSFCSICGKPALSPKEFAESKKQHLNTVIRTMQRERIAWWVSFIVSLLTVVSLLILFDGAPYGSFTVEMMGSQAMEYSYNFAQLILLQSLNCFVSIGMILTTSYFLATLPTDCRKGIRRAGNAFYIVLGALFNPLALIYIILNYIFVKSNPAIFHQIGKGQTSQKTA